MTVLDTTWVVVCRYDDLVPERGAAALIGTDQVALFRLLDGRVLAVDQHDPYSDAYVMSRGIVGTRGDVPTVASPMYKQVFDLTTGVCLDAAGKTPHRDLPPDLRSWSVRVRDGQVEVETR